MLLPNGEGSCKSDGVIVPGRSASVGATLALFGHRG